MKTFSTFFAVAGMAAVASAHMEMTEPAPFRSKNNPNLPDGSIDYSMTSPLSQDGSDFPCKGYLDDFKDPVLGATVANWAPGQTYSMTVGGSATHNGGSCQVSLSVDEGATWKVIHSYIGNCPTTGGSYDFAIPSDTPTGKAIFAWTWFNQVGNREMYMNCASVQIGGTEGARARAVSDSFSSRPDMFVANIGNGCKTTEGTDVSFPNPGPDVTREGSSEGPPEGSCAAGAGGGNGGAPVESNPGSPPVSSPAPPAPPASEVPASPSTTAPGGIFITEPAPTPTPSTLLTVTRSEEPAPAPTGGNSGEGAMPVGAACDTEGTWNCVGGSQFQRCASGQWSALQPVYSGTTCTPGQSESFDVKAVARDEFSGSSILDAIKRMF